MNIAKLQSQLQRVPDQALIGYVQNPDGQVPSFLALAELTRRKEMRKAAPQGQMPTQTVAAQEVAQAEPGIAQLPVREDMFNEQSMAAGGIVAFDEGGEVPRYNGTQGSFIQLRPEQYEMLTPLQKQQYVNQFGAPPAQAGRGLNPLEKALGIDRRPSPMMEVLTKGTPLVPEQATMPAAPRIEVPVGNIPNREMAPGIAALKTTPVDKQIPPDIDTSVPRRAAAQVPIERLTYEGPEDLSGKFDETLRPEISAQEAMSKYQGLLGTDTGRQKMQERLEGMEAKAAKDEERAPWMALAEAGLGMAGGRSQFAIQNIAEGGIRGIKSYGEARDRLGKAEERRFDIASKLAQAERAEQVAAATYGLQSEEAARAGREANRLAQLNYKANLASDKAKGNFEAKKGNLEADLATAKLEEDKRYHDLWYRSNMEKTKRDAITLEKSIMSNNTTQLKTLMSESGKLLKEMMDSGKEDTPLYASTLQIYNGAADALGLKAGVSTTPPAASLPPLDARSASRYIKN
jgi:hypothetical protein